MPRVVSSVPGAFKINLTVKGASARATARLFQDILQRPDPDAAPDISRRISSQESVLKHAAPTLGHERYSDVSHNARAQAPPSIVPVSSSTRIGNGQNVKYLTNLSKRELQRVVKMTEEKLGYHYRNQDLCLEALDLIASRERSRKLLSDTGKSAMAHIWTLWRWRHNVEEELKFNIDDPMWQPALKRMAELGKSFIHIGFRGLGSACRNQSAAFWVLVVGSISIDGGTHSVEQMIQHVGVRSSHAVLTEAGRRQAAHREKAFAGLIAARQQDIDANNINHDIGPVVNATDRESATTPMSTTEDPFHTMFDKYEQSESNGDEESDGPWDDLRTDTQQEMVQDDDSKSSAPCTKTPNRSPRARRRRQGLNRKPNTPRYTVRKCLAPPGRSRKHEG